MDTNIDIVIESRDRQLVGDFKVRRVLPSAKRRMVGPFIFLDEMGPEILEGEKALDVAPHPHIGLATVTYLFKGEILHRDSLGSVQPILPGAVNWMTAGKGIAHSERTPDEKRGAGGELFGIQSWVALPERDEESTPAFAHHGTDELPVVEDTGMTARIIAGELFGGRSPVRTLSEMFYADVSLEKGVRLPVPKDHEERGVFVVEGSVAFESEEGEYGAGRLVVFRPGSEIVLRCESPTARLMLLGGEPLGKRHIWWNFVSSSRDQIEEAKTLWRNGGFERVPGETEYIPLPDEPNPKVVRYP